MQHDAAQGGWPGKPIVAGVIALAGMKAFICCCVSLHWASLLVLVLALPVPMISTWPPRCLPPGRRPCRVCPAQAGLLTAPMRQTRADPASDDVTAGPHS